MTIDSLTLLVSCCALLTILGLAFIVLWLLDRRSTWLLWWGVPPILNALTLIFYVGNDWETGALPIVLGNAVRLYALGCLWYGIRAFQGQKRTVGVLSGLSLLWGLLCLYPPFFEHLAARVVAFSLLSALICGLAVRDLWIMRGDGMRSRVATMLVIGSFGLLMLARVAFVTVTPFPFGAGAPDPLWLAFYTWSAQGHALLAAILFFSMTMERREAEQRAFAMADPLTGLLNRRAFAEFASRLERRTAGHAGRVAVLALDLDGFKQVNDRYGHALGDRMLQEFAALTERNARASDQIFRLGGEEFCVVLPDTGVAEAMALAERIRAAFEALEIPTASGPAATTVSIGVAVTQVAVDLSVLLAAADAAAYEAKARGRNRVVVAEPGALLRPQAERPAERRRA